MDTVDGYGHDDGYSHGVVMKKVMKKRLRLVSHLGILSVVTGFSMVCTDGFDETNTVFGEEGEMTTTGLLLSPLSVHTGVDGGMVTVVRRWFTYRR